MAETLVPLSAASRLASTMTSLSALSVSLSVAARRQHANLIWSCSRDDGTVDDDVSPGGEGHRHSEVVTGE